MPMQIIEDNRRPSTSEKFGKAFSNIGQSLGENIPKLLMKNELIQKENEAAKNLGVDLSGINDPKMRQEVLGIALQGVNQLKLEELKQQGQESKSSKEQFVDEKSYGKIKETFGEKFADIWKAAPVGGKTELLKQGIDSILRGNDVNEMLKGVEPPLKQDDAIPSELPKDMQMKDGKVSGKFNWPDYSKRPSGYSPKDWIEERKTWRKENSPVFLENKTKLQNNKRDAVSIKKLDKLNKSKKVAEGFERTLINPSTGEPYGLASLTGSMSPETQEWIKEIARFQNRAKDSFGSRVTNFDLISYMKQFPGLLNTHEGRERIIKMMTVNNQLDQKYESALEKVFQKYGLSGIPQEEADKLAQSFIQEDVDRLSNEYLGLDEKNEMEDSSQLSGRMIDVIGPDGQEYEIDEKEVDKLPQGFRLK